MSSAAVCRHHSPRAFLSRIAILIATVFFATACMAQDSTPTASSQPSSSIGESSEQPQSTPEGVSITIPAGTRIPVVLTYPISTRTTQSGDDFHVQTTAPVTVGAHVAIPAGTFLQGTVDKLSRKGNRGEVRLRGAQLIFSNGYIAAITGRSELLGAEGSAWINPSGRTKAGAILAPAIGTGIGAAIGSAAHTTQSATLGGQTITTATAKGLAIGSMAGLAAGATVSLFLLLHSHQFDMPDGAPMEMTLREPVVLTGDEFADAIEAGEENPQKVPTPNPHPGPPAGSSKAGTGPQHICFTPGTPGTPSTTIPGIPGPNGIPGPPTVIPGTPATPPTPYPCP